MYSKHFPEITIKHFIGIIPMMVALALLILTPLLLIKSGQYLRPAHRAQCNATVTPPTAQPKRS